ncbi:DUF5655 domain-containing protein [Marinobacterium arenosum]|uniref:DUF5655 domain-containing protein n=1 Tax=Marinobacterium arenosum TaxID=2862496 RepID=UPI001C980200|nr:DUF5655 domain-containing protein [Marinobacterium arenosum]MBY4678890.1 DUF5655 domain-containing protein [Marinobacterium arenosum]
MSDIKLFSLGAGQVNELAGSSALLEKDLQTLIESQLEAFLGVRFLASEYSTGKTHKGRIDTLGLDENNCPVIIEYKRHSNENVINQGLFYLDWLLDHQAEFRWLVMEKLDKEVAESIEWGGTRLICIAADFNRYDEHAVQQINRNIELMRYRYFGDELLLLELINAQSAAAERNNGKAVTATTTVSETARPTERNDTQKDRIAQASPEVMTLYRQICDYAYNLGDEVQRKELKLYTAFKRIRNFASVLVWSPVRDPCIRLYLKLNPAEVELEAGFIEDVRGKGHWGTGDLEVSVRCEAQLARACELIQLSYEQG